MYPASNAPLGGDPQGTVTNKPTNPKDESGV